MDNNLAERALRGPATQIVVRFIQRNRSATGRAALFRAHLAGLSPHPRDYLQVCAERNGQPPEDARAWLPWGVGRVRTWRAAAPQGP